MHIISGKAVSKGRATGRFHFIKNNTHIIEEEHCKKTEHELLAYQRARGDSLNQLQSIYEKALCKVGEEDAKIFSIQQMILYEDGFNNSVRDMIVNENVTAKYAVYKLALDYMTMLEATNDEYMSARRADIHDVTQRIIRNIGKKKYKLLSFPIGRNIIIYKNHFTPSEVIEIDTKNISAAITMVDSYYSHSAILSRNMKLPGITGVSEDIYQYDGKIITVDADKGEISIEMTG